MLCELPFQGFTFLRKTKEDHSILPITKLVEIKLVINFGFECWAMYSIKDYTLEDFYPPAYAFTNFGPQGSRET